MSMVVMRHPTLPAGQEIEVDEGAVWHYAGAGWMEVPAEELEARAAAEAKAVAEARAAVAGEASDDKPPVRSRVKSPEKKAEE